MTGYALVRRRYSSGFSFRLQNNINIALQRQFECNLKKKHFQKIFQPLKLETLDRRRRGTPEEVNVRVRAVRLRWFGENGIPRECLDAALRVYLIRIGAIWRAEFKFWDKLFWVHFKMFWGLRLTSGAKPPKLLLCWFALVFGSASCTPSDDLVRRLWSTPIVADAPTALLKFYRRPLPLIERFSFCSCSMLKWYSRSATSLPSGTNERPKDSLMTGNCLSAELTTRTYIISSKKSCSICTKRFRIRKEASVLYVVCTIDTQVPICRLNR